MPEAVRTCAQCHHNPSETGAHATLTAIVAYADYLSHTLGSHPQSERQADQALVEDLIERIGLSPEQNSVLVKLVGTDFQQTDAMA